MKLLHLGTAGVRGLPDARHAFTDPRTGAPLPVVLVTGAPASGKTSLLEAIAAAKEAAGAYGAPPDPKRFLRPGARDPRLTATWLLSPAEQARAGLERAEQTVTWDLVTGRTDAGPGLRRLFSEHSRSPERGKLEYFPADRRLPPLPRTAFGGASREATARDRAVRAPDKYACLIEGLRALAAEDEARAARALRDHGVAVRTSLPDALGPFREAVAAVLPDLRLDAVTADGPRFLRRNREEVALEELSDSERQGLIFALAFPHLGLDGSLVLIDGPELHVHAAHQARFLRAVVGLGRDNQVIVATGSAELLREATPGQVIDLSRPR